MMHVSMMQPSVEVRSFMYVSVCTAVCTRTYVYVLEHVRVRMYVEVMHACSLTPCSYNVDGVEVVVVRQVCCL